MDDGGVDGSGRRGVVEMDEKRESGAREREGERKRERIGVYRSIFVRVV